MLSRLLEVLLFNGCRLLFCAIHINILCLLLSSGWLNLQLVERVWYILYVFVSVQAYLLILKVVTLRHLRRFWILFLWIDRILIESIGLKKSILRHLFIKSFGFFLMKDMAFCVNKGSLKLHLVQISSFLVIKAKKVLSLHTLQNFRVPYSLW